MALNDGIPDNPDDAIKVIEANKGADAGVACMGCRHDDMYLRFQVADFQKRKNTQMKAMKNLKKNSTILDRL